MSALTTVEVLRGAKAVLERNGWTQGQYVADEQATSLNVPYEECRVCLIGAINLARGRMPSDLTSIGRIAAMVEEAIAAREGIDVETGISIPTWNDISGRTLAEVYALLDEAIERAEAGDPR